MFDFQAANPAKVKATDSAFHMRASLILLNQCLASRAIGRRNAILLEPDLNAQVGRAGACFAVVLLSAEFASLAAAPAGDLPANGFSDVEDVFAVGQRAK